MDNKSEIQTNQLMQEMTDDFFRINGISRKNLSKVLGVSERYLRDNAEFQKAEIKIGGRVFYNAIELAKIFKIGDKKNESE